LTDFHKTWHEQYAVVGILHISFWSWEICVTLYQAEVSLQYISQIQLNLQKNVYMAFNRLHWSLKLLYETVFSFVNIEWNTRPEYL